MSAKISPNRKSVAQTSLAPSAVATASTPTPVGADIPKSKSNGVQSMPSSFTKATQKPLQILVTISKEMHGTRNIGSKQLGG